MYRLSRIDLYIDTTRPKIALRSRNKIKYLTPKTNLTKVLTPKTPPPWIRHCYRELHANNTYLRHHGLIPLTQLMHKPCGFVINPFTPACAWRHSPLRYGMCLQAHRNISDIIYKIEMVKIGKELQETHQNHRLYSYESL